MSDILSKYNLLDKAARKEVLDFIDLLLSKKKAKKKSLSAYKEKILSVSTWTDEELKVFDENRKFFNQWKTEEW